MATITGLTATRMQEIIDSTIVDADVIGDNLILTKEDGSTIDAGDVRGAPGVGVVPDLMRDSFGPAIQEGIISGGQVTRLSSSSIRVAAGTAWIKGDSVSGFGTGLYPVSWPQTDIVGIPVAASGNTRWDIIVLTLTGTPFAGTTSVNRVGGVEVAGVPVAPAVPDNSVKLAEMLISNTGIPVFSSSNYTDRRPWARGACYVYTANGIADYTTTSTGWTNIDTTVLSPRLEISSGIMQIAFRGNLISSSGQSYFMYDAPAEVNGGSGNGMLGTSPAPGWEGNAQSLKSIFSFVHEISVTPGSKGINFRWASDAGQNIYLKRSAGTPLSLIVREILTPSQSNGVN